MTLAKTHWAPASAGTTSARHIGIVGVSAEGAALCYRTLCSEGAALFGRHAHPEVTMHTYPLAAYMRHIDAGDWDAVGELLLSSAARLQLAGADLLICPDNTVHQAIDIVRGKSPLPWLHIAEEVAAVARNYADNVSVVPSVPDAVRAALADATPQDMVLITGSFYTVGEVPPSFWQ